MKKIIYILLFLPLQIFATNYYVKNGGNDAADGRSDATAWATISKVNSASLTGGDTVFFKRGDVWREFISLEVKSGSSGNPIVYSNYGTGDLPLFLNSKQENETSDWSDQGNNLWRNSDANFATEVGNIIFNNGESFGIRVATEAAVNSQGKFYYDATNKRITLYSTSNPATYYSNIECALNSPSAKISFSNRSNVVIDGFAIKYVARHGIGGSVSSNIIIRNCDIRYIGGAMAGSTLRLGNGIEFWASASGILIEKNYIAQCYDAGITSQYIDQSLTVNGIEIRYNVLEKNDMNFEWWYSNCTGTISNIKVHNNTFLSAGKGWSHNQKPGNVHSWHMYIAHLHTLTVTNISIKNNIFSDALVCSFWNATNPSSLIYSLIDWDNNIYNDPDVVRIGTSYYDFDYWQTFSSEDVHSIEADPLLNTNFTLQEGSPAIDAGADLGYTYDYFGRIVPYNLIPDIGASEWGAELPPPPPLKDGIILIHGDKILKSGNKILIIEKK